MGVVDSTATRSDRFSTVVESRNAWMIRKAHDYGNGQIRRADAQDITQTVLIRTWQARTWATLDDRALKSYLATAVKYATSNYLRGNRRRDRAIAMYAVEVKARCGSRVPPKAGSDVHNTTIRTSRLRHPEAKALHDTLINEMLTRKALDRLPAQQREIVLGIIWEQSPRR
jgi:DNA-directed RNA polymerase specialized sigma24 family protein